MLLPRRFLLVRCLTSVLAQGEAELHPHLRRRYLAAGELAGELVQGAGGVVGWGFVIREGFFERPAAGEAVVDGVCEVPGVAEGVADTEAGDEVAVVAGVADKRPAGAVGAAEEVALLGGADVAGLAAGVPHALGERGDELEVLAIVAVDIAAELVELIVGAADADAGEAVVGGKDEDTGAFQEVQLGAVTGKAAPVGVVAEGKRRLRVVLPRADAAGDGGVEAVGADDDAGALLDGCRCRAAADAGDAAAFEDDLADGEALAELDAGGHGGADPG